MATKKWCVYTHVNVWTLCYTGTKRTDCPQSEWRFKLGGNNEQGCWRLRCFLQKCRGTSMPPSNFTILYAVWCHGEAKWAHAGLSCELYIIWYIKAYAPKQRKATWFKNINITWHHISLHHHTISHHTTPHHTPYHNTPHHITHRITSHHTTSHHTPYHITPHHITHHITSHHTTSHHIGVLSSQILPLQPSPLLNPTTTNSSRC